MRRSLLFIPGNTPNQLINGNRLGADAVIFDLEDAVPPFEKDSARVLVRNTIKHLDFSSCEIIVRINSIDTKFWEMDIDEILSEKLNFILLPKANTADDVKLVNEYISLSEKKLGLKHNTVRLIPLIESALGIENAFLIASACDRVAALLLGAEDLTTDLRCMRTKDGKEIEYARTRLVTAARAANIDVYDTPFTDVNDENGITTDSLLAKSLGFTGKASISPHHIKAINEVFSPSPEDINHAYEVMDAIRLAHEQGRGAISLHGKMVDAPIVARASQIIALAEQIGIGKGDTK